MLDDKEVETIRMAMAIDTDGHIVISKQNEMYSMSIGFTNTNIKLIEWVVNNYGGKIPNARNHNNINHKEIYGWQVYSYKAYKILKIIRPYLIIKGEQADLAMELYEKVSKWKYVRNHRMPEHKRRLAEDLYLRCRHLNKKGKPIEQIESKLKLKSRKTIETLEEFV